MYSNWKTARELSSYCTAFHRAGSVQLLASANGQRHCSGSKSLLRSPVTTRSSTSTVVCTALRPQYLSLHSDRYTMQPAWPPVLRCTVEHNVEASNSPQQQYIRGRFHTATFALLNFTDFSLQGISGVSLCTGT